MGGFQVRPATADDLDAIAAGFGRASLKPGATVAAKVRWALGSNPRGWSGIVAVDTRSQIVGHFGVSHVPVLLEGEPLVFGRVYASWLDPMLRIAGVHGAFPEIDDAFRDAFEGKTIDATFGVFDDADWWTLRRMRDFRPVRTEILLERKPMPHRAERPTMAVDRIAGAEGLGGGLSLAPCFALRDAATLAFRLGGPFGGDQGWVARREGLPAGLVVFRDTDSCRLVLDFAVPAGDEGSAQALFDLVIGDGGRKVALPHFSRSPWFFLAQRKGFRAVASDLPYVGVRPARSRIQAEWLMEHWHFGASDVGLRPIPRMLASEEIVTSAPIGTLTGKERHA